VPVTAGPGNQRASDAAARDHLRASHADREHVVDVIKTAFVQGRLTKAEMDARAGQAFAARTYADLAVLTADLPAGLAAAQPPRPARAQARQPMSNAAKAGIWVVIAVAVPMVLFLSGGEVLFLLFTPFYFMALAFLGAEIVASRLKTRSLRGQLPPGPAPGTGSQAPRPLPSAGPRRQLPPGHDGYWYTAEDAPIVRPRLLPT
jgi:DUF1707 SHOCT-like domain